VHFTLIPSAALVIIVVLVSYTPSAPPSLPASHRRSLIATFGIMSFALFTRQPVADG
jgi:hypothetical protein